MRIRGFHAENFLTFDNFELNEIDPNLITIVGPNGSGKSNFVRALRLLREAFSDKNWYTKWGWAQRFGTQEGFLIEFSIELTESKEKNLIIGLIQAITAECALLSVQGDPLQDKIVKEFIEVWIKKITAESVQSLFRGRLRIMWSKQFYEVAYRFKHDQQEYDVVFSGNRRAFGIWPVSVSQPLKMCQLGEILKQNLGGGFNLLPHPPFHFGLLLDPQKAALIPPLKDLPNLPSLLSYLHGVLDVVSPNVEQWSPFEVFGFIVRSSLVIMGDSRSPLNTEWKLDELNRPVDAIDLTDTRELPCYLFRLKNGTLEERQVYNEIKNFFRELTDRCFEVSIQILPEERERPNGRPFHIYLVVEENGVDVEHRFAGAGVKEVIALSAFLAGRKGRVIVLDEPALNLHPLLQRRILGKLRNSENQVIVITHSPYLVPDNKEDLGRIIRFELVNGITRAHQFILSLDSTNIRQCLRYFQRPEVRALLFTQGVVLVEGDTEWGAFPVWARKTRLEDEELTFFSVDGDNNFREFVRLLKAWGIPWTVVCDGAVLSPAHPNWIFDQLQDTGVSFNDEDKQKLHKIREQYSEEYCSEIPNDEWTNLENRLHEILEEISRKHSEQCGETQIATDLKKLNEKVINNFQNLRRIKKAMEPGIFEEIINMAKKYGVFTLAQDFKDEIEDFLRRKFPVEYAEAEKQFKSKVLRGRFLAESTDPPDAVKNLFECLRERIRTQN